MKKTLLALATLSAMAGSAFAADVTVYGLVDYGFQFKHVDQYTQTGDDNTFQMKSGMNSGSRFGLKGSEDLGNGLKVGFVLENGFNADDGTLDNGGRLFGRESQLYVQGAFGTLSFGRVGQLMSGLGSYGLMSKFSVFGDGWGDYTGGKFTHAGYWGRMDNTITYVTPEFAGLKGYLQYSFQNDTQDKDLRYGAPTEGKASSDRTLSAAVTANYGNFGLLVAGDWNNWSENAAASASWAGGDGYTGLVAATYDFGVAKLYVDGQYYKRMRIANAEYEKLSGLNGEFASFWENTAYADGYAFNIGTDVPAFGGTFKANFGYRYAECIKNPDGNNDDRYTLSAGYTYDLSKRTSLYAAGSYVWSDLSSNHNDSNLSKSPEACELIAGLIHRF